MRGLLVLAFLLYDIITEATKQIPYDYDDIIGIKRHSFVDERRDWRKKALLKPFDQEYKEYERRHEHDIPGYLDEAETKRSGQRELDPPESLYRGQRRYEDNDDVKLMPKIKNDEIENSAHYLERDRNEKTLFTMTCERQHERYEPCFAGCAAVSCDNPHERLRPCYPFCEPGCICSQPYVRDDRTHKCVLPDDCTKGLKGIPDLGDDA